MSNILIYQDKDGLTKIDVRLENETLWITQQQMADLFQTTKQNVSLHISNIYKESELQEWATVKDFLTVQHEGINEHILNIYAEGELQESNSMRKIGNSDFSTKPTNYYNLDVIISVGYRVKSLRGTQFRQWAINDR